MPLKEQVLYVDRFNGKEEYEITQASWNLYKDNGRANLCIYLKSDKAVKLNEDTAEIFQTLNWELNVVENSLSDEDLVAGYKYEIPEGYDETREGWITNFYYHEHSGSDNNKIEILDRNDNELLVKMTGEVNDVNYYDGSKAKAKLGVLAWLKKKPKMERSMN